MMRVEQVDSKPKQIKSDHKSTTKTISFSSLHYALQPRPSLDFVSFSVFLLLPSSFTHYTRMECIEGM